MGTLLSGGYDITIGSNSEKMQWDATISFTEAKGKFKLIADENEKTTVFTGPLTLKMNDNSIDYEMLIDTEPVITWKQGYTPREADKRAGSRLFGTIRKSVADK